MSGLLERIVRRRRASASTRLGPPWQNGVAPADYSNAGPPELSSASVNGTPSAHSLRAEPVELEVLMWVPPSTHADEANFAPPDDGGEQPTIEIHADAVDAALQVGESDETIDFAPVAPEVEPEFVEVGVEPDPVAPEVGPEFVAPEVEPEFEPEFVEVGPEPVAPEVEPEFAPEPATSPNFRERGRIRRRARYLRQLRELQLRDIGGFILELRRFGRERPDLVEAKISGAAEVDRELRALERALGEEETIRELRAAGIGGACLHCGTVHGSLDRFCASCGHRLDVTDGEDSIT